MSHRFIVLGLFLVVIVICVQFCPTISQADEYEYEDEEPAVVGSQSQSTIPAPSTVDEYEYEYEDEEPSATHFQQKPVDNQNDIEIIARNGFIRHGGGLMKIGRPLMDDIYVNETMDKYDCVRFVDSLVHIVEPQEEDDDVMNVTAQIQELKQKMDRVMYMAAYKTSDTGTEGKEAPVDPSLRTIQPKNETQANATEASEPKRKRMSFREKQALRLQQRKERELAREALRPKFRLGADCETLICGSCKAIVDEFGQLVFNAIRDPKVKYIDQLTENFCGSKMIMVKYMDLVHDVCGAFEQETLGYKEALVSAFEGLQRWEDANKLPVLARMKKQLCSSIGACEIEQFDFQTESFHYTQDQWDDQCFTCQAFAKDLEERVHLTRHLTERNIVPLVAETCDRLDLDPHYRQVCQPLTEGKLLDDVAWLAKMHGESVARKAKAELKFPDKLCQEIDWCKPWIDPDKLKEMEAEANMEQVFF